MSDLKAEVFWQERQYWRDCFTQLVQAFELYFDEYEYDDFESWCNDFHYEAENAGIFKRNKDESSLRFVGVMEMTYSTDEESLKFTVYSFPKYYDLPKNISHDENDKTVGELKDSMSYFLRAIEKTSHSKDFNVTGIWNENITQDRDNIINPYELEEWIVRDYCNNGIYFKQLTDYRSNDTGHIDWGRTIEKTFPVISRGESLYLSPVSVHRSQDYTNLISQLHIKIVKECLDSMRRLGKFENIDFPYESELNDKIKLEQFAPAIASYRRSVFAARETALMKALESYCRNKSRYYELPRGTVSFELVWEDVLRGVFGNVPKFRFDAPVYSLYNDNKKAYEEYSVNSESEADIIYVDKNKDGQSRFLLIDAKYYTGKKGCDNLLSDFPEYASVGKQIDYYHTLVTQYGLKNGYNMFFFPKFHSKDNKALGIDQSEENWLKCFGTVRKRDNVSGENPLIQAMEKHGIKAEHSSKASDVKERIYLFQIDPEPLYKLFINEVSESEKRKFADEIIEMIKDKAAGQ